jgi:hypothetical protein
VKRRGRRSTPGGPVELRFLDLFMMIVAALVFVVVSLSLFGVQQSAPADPPPLEVATAALPAAVQGLPYDAYLAGRGGTGPYTWRILAGAPPYGMRFDGPTGRLSGVPGEAQPVRLAVELRDGAGSRARRALALHVQARSADAPLGVEGAAAVLPEAVSFRRYHARLRLEGGTPPYAATLVEGRLPDGLRLAADGGITGVPRFLARDRRLAAPWPLTVRVRDGEGAVALRRVLLPVRYAPRPTWGNALAADVGAGIGRALRYVVLPVLCASALLVIGTLVIGFPGGSTGEWRGLLRRRDPRDG